MLRATIISLFLALLAPPALAGPFKTDRPIKAVVLGGSVSEYYAGNYGQFLAHGCQNLEVVNRAKAKKGVPALVKRLNKEVIGDRKLMAGTTDGKRWLIWQGGLNSVFSPEMANYHLARLFQQAHDGGFQVMALTLVPWGSHKDARFRGFRGVRTVRQTKQINNFLKRKLSPQRALGRRARNHPHEWMQGELPDITVDVFDSPLRDSGAALRDMAALNKAFSRSRYRRKKARKAAIVAEARAVPRQFMKKKYWAFNHYHPNTAGHRQMALAACAQAPKSWGCDCKRIAAAVFRKGKVRAP